MLAHENECAIHCAHDGQGAQLTGRNFGWRWSRYYIQMPGISMRAMPILFYFYLCRKAHCRATRISRITSLAINLLRARRLHT